MNVIDRSFAAEAYRLEKAERARKKLRHKLAIVAGVAIVLAAIASYVWATTLCGDCGAPVALSPPPA
jgi:hypothetical protein